MAENPSDPQFTDNELAAFIAGLEQQMQPSPSAHVTAPAGSNSANGGAAYGYNPLYTLNTGRIDFRPRKPMRRAPSADDGRRAGSGLPGGGR